MYAEGLLLYVFVPLACLMAVWPGGTPEDRGMAIAASVIYGVILYGVSQVHAWGIWATIAAWVFWLSVAMLVVGAFLNYLTARRKALHLLAI